MKIVPKKEGAVNNTIKKQIEKKPAHHFRPLKTFKANSLMISPFIVSYPTSSTASPLQIIL